MRKIILSVAVSLDGYIEGPNKEYDWCPPPTEEGMKKFLDGIDAIFMGRKSYEMAGNSMFPDKKCYVFSNTMEKVEGDARIIGGKIDNEVKKIREQPGKNIWLFGGANLTTYFINNNLVDEMWLGLIPVVLGAGTPLFQNIESRHYFTAESAVKENGYFSLTLKRK